VSVSPGQTGPSPEAGCLQLAAVASLCVGVLLSIMGLAHLYGVMVTATRQSYAYDFRLAALLLLGMALVFAAGLCLSAVIGLARGQRAAWGRAVIGTLLLLLVLVPLGPIQPDMAPGLAFLAAVNLIVLLAVRRGLQAG
jgi:hypothetical protein